MAAILNGRPLRTATSPDGSVTLTSYEGDLSAAGYFCACEACDREMALVRRTTRPGDCVVDVGANMGHFTVLYSQLVGPAGHVVALEPDAANFALLEHNLALNGVSNVTALQIAASDRREAVQLFQSGTNLGRHSLHAENVPNVAGSTYVDSTPIDALVAELGLTPNVLKIDVEGGELRVLRGAADTISSSARIVWLELWPDGTAAAAESVVEALEGLREAGYRLTAIDLFTGEEQSLPEVGASIALVERLIREADRQPDPGTIRLIEILAAR